MSWSLIKKNQSILGAVEFWAEHKTDDGRSYYYNSKTQETTWTKPKEMSITHKKHSHAANKTHATEDLRSLRTFRDKKKYTKIGHDHLRVGKTFQNEKVLFSDLVYRVIPPRHHKPSVVEPAKLVVTANAVYDVNIAHAPGDKGSLLPERRIPLRAIQHIVLHKKHAVLTFRTVHVKFIHAIQYYNANYQLIANKIVRAHVVLTKTGLKRKMNAFKVLTSIEELATKEAKKGAKGTGMFGVSSQMQAVAAFRGGMATGKASHCNYCKCEIESSTRRHGEFVYHIECDPRERAVAKNAKQKQIEEAAAMKQSRTRTIGHDDVHITGTLSERRETERQVELTRKQQAKNQRQLEYHTALQKIEDEQKQKEEERQLKINNLLERQQQKVLDYELKQKKIWSKLKCAGCQDPFLGGHFYHVFEEIWHPACFACHECGVRFGDFGYYVRPVNVRVVVNGEDPETGGTGSVKHVMLERPFCRDHCEATWFGKTLMWAGDVSANLRRRLLCERVVDWVHEKGKIPEDHRDAVEVSDDPANNANRIQRELHKTEVKSEWYYVDENTNQSCGPYKASEIINWKRSKHLSKHVRILKTGETEYSTFMTRVAELYTAVRQENFDLEAKNTKIARSGGGSIGNPLLAATARPQQRATHKKHLTSDGKLFYESIMKPGVTAWTLPAGGVVLNEAGGPQVPFSTERNTTTKTTKQGSGSGRGKKTKTKTKKKINQRETRHRRILTQEGVPYFEDIERRTTSWTLPENGIVVDGTALPGSLDASAASVNPMVSKKRTSLDVAKQIASQSNNRPTTSAISSKRTSFGIAKQIASQSTTTSTSVTGRSGAASSRPSRHRRFRTADGVEYFEDVERRTTSWTLPELGVLITEGTCTEEVTF